MLGSGVYAGDVTALLCVPQLTATSPPAPGRDGSNGSIGSDTPPPPPPAPPASLLLAGIGSQLLVYTLPAGRLCGCATVLPDAVRVHGIAALPVPSSSGARPQVLAAVHGRQHAAFVRLLGPADDDTQSGSDNASWEVQPLLLLPLSLHRPWTMDVRLSWGGAACDTVLLAVGLSSNAVEVFSIRPDAPGCPATRVLHAECTDRLLLYSLALAPRPCATAAAAQQQQRPEQQQQRSGSSGGGGTHWLVAAGTILLDVLVWATPEAASGGPAVGPDAPTLLAPLLRLKGHEGSIHR